MDDIPDDHFQKTAANEKLVAATLNFVGGILDQQEAERHAAKVQSQASALVAPAGCDPGAGI